MHLSVKRSERRRLSAALGKFKLKMQGSKGSNIFLTSLVLTSVLSGEKSLAVASGSLQCDLYGGGTTSRRGRTAEQAAEGYVKLGGFFCAQRSGTEKRRQNAHNDTIVRHKGCKYNRRSAERGKIHLISNPPIVETGLN